MLRVCDFADKFFSAEGCPTRPPPPGAVKDDDDDDGDDDDEEDNVFQ